MAEKSPQKKTKNNSTKSTKPAPKAEEIVNPGSSVNKTERQPNKTDGKHNCHDVNIVVNSSEENNAAVLGEMREANRISRKSLYINSFLALLTFGALVSSVVSLRISINVWRDSRTVSNMEREPVVQLSDIRIKSMQADSNTTLLYNLVNLGKYPVIVISTRFTIVDNTQRKVWYMPDIDSFPLGDSVGVNSYIFQSTYIPGIIISGEKLSYTNYNEFIM